MSILQERDGFYDFFCPGCEHFHSFNTNPKHWNGMVWEFNGDMDKPTFTPSLLNKSPRKGGGERVCHIYLTDGRIHFLNDCTHKLAGRVVEIPEWPG